MVYPLREPVAPSRDATTNSIALYSHAPGQYCSDPDIDTELAQLHGALLYGNCDVQIEIDRRLPACIAADSGWDCDPQYKHIPLKWLYTAAEDTIQYDRLPDIARFICGTRARDCRILHILIQGAIPCLRKGRISANPFDVLDKNDDTHSFSTSDSEMSACINVLYGTLLGLYPTSSKKPTFHVRKALFRVLRTLSTNLPAVQRVFLSQMPCVLRLALMEYVVNVTQDHCPSTYSYLSSIKGMDVYYATCGNLCDSFRTEALQCDTGYLSWEDIEKHASTLVERFTRTCKFRIHREAPKKLEITTKILQSWRKTVCTPEQRNTAMEVMRSALQLPIATTKGATRTLMKQVRKIDLPHIVDPDNSVGSGIAATAIEALHTNVRCYTLPGNLAKLVCKSLMKFAWNPQKLYSISRVHICIWCINKAVHGNTAKAISSSLRMDVQSNCLACAVCTKHGNDISPPVIGINMIGRLLSVGGKFHFLCPGCCRVHPWEGNGSEFNGTCCHSNISKKTARLPKSARLTDSEKHSFSLVKVQLSAEQTTCVLKACTVLLHVSDFPHLAKRLQSTEVNNNSVTQFFTLSSSVVRWKDCSCMVCSKRNSCHVVRTLHIGNRPRIVSLFLCSRHMPYEHTQKYIYDTVSLCRVIGGKKDYYMI